VSLAISPVGQEALDRPGAPRAVVETTLKDIARINAWLGGRSAAAFGLDALLHGALPGRPLTLLDVGAGSGDIVHYLTRRAARRGVTLTPLVMERHPVAARLCRQAGLPVVLSDGARLPLSHRSVDVVLLSQVLHHLTRESAATLLRELNRVARLGVVVADLRRHVAAALGIWLASYPLRLHPVTRRDGVTSVRRGFTPAELVQVLRLAGVSGAVHRRPGFRLVAVWQVAGAHG
jgi:ubiquinone/menaquinone biosynthesis C-methylase UbiE